MVALNADTVRSNFVVGLRDAHAVEHQALALIDRQLDRLKNYDAVAEQLRLHRGETESQTRRLEEILASLDESPSSLKDLGLSLTGNLAALGHTVAGDEILKNTFANFAFENFEAASYRSLIAMAEAGGFGSALDPLKQSLEEELAMAAWIETRIPALTLTYLDRASRGEKADR
ncbi:ferritin-like domain-containing protein [Chelatococcus sambhunathii]|uniref:Ferritin-like domain-containing protein n=1 Tax=Chelatococcus sambhunathii TaxID=363953 RepID=A0ABU1DHU7_9HYPH|nr:ferritin-like domain-containing protein [Chelatococcus sambhunathii]MDR4307703.1 ferritin-like domain-containing protein [Chelatococcus sambhunathii]